VLLTLLCPAAPIKEEKILEGEKREARLGMSLYNGPLTPQATPAYNRGKKKAAKKKKKNRRKRG